MAFKGIAPDIVAEYKQTIVADPPPGVTPDYQNSHRALVGIVCLCTLCLALTTFFVVMRMYTRHAVIKSLWWDDWFSLLAWTFFIPLTAFAIVSHGDGTGRHMWNVHYSDFVQISYDSIIIKAIYFVAIVMVKLSILLQYLRIFVPSKSGNELMYYGAVSQMVLNVVFYLIEFFINIFQCSPRAYAWNRWFLQGTCIGTDSGAIDSNLVPTAAFNVASDIVILLLPLNRVWRLQLPLRTKVGVCLVFGTGAVVCLTSILRLYYTRKFVEAADETYWEAFLGAWLYLEVAVGIIVGCMPSFPKFGQHVKGLWEKSGSAEPSSRFIIISKPFKSERPKDPYDVHNHLHGSDLLPEECSIVELEEWQNYSVSAEGSLI